MISSIDTHNIFVPIGIKNSIRSRFIKKQIFAVNAYQLKLNNEWEDKPICM